MHPDEALRRAKRAWRLVDDPAPLGTTKNLTQRCRDRAGRRVLLKCAPNPLDRGITKEARALEVLSSSRLSALRVPKVVAFEPRSQVLAMEWMSGAPSLYARHHAAGRLPLRVLEPLGAALGALHASTASAAEWEWAAPPEEALIDCFVWTRPAFSTRLSIDGMLLFGQVQADKKAIAALIELSGAPRSCLIHGDAKALNVLLPRRGPPVLIDWELAQLGDPAQDIGCLLGDLTRCHVAPESRAERIDARTLSAATRALLAGYRRERPLSDEELRRVRLWTGAHLLIYAHVLVLADGVLHALAASLLREARRMLGERR
jgi:aminoglycoside phosphotransferase (APT) family kinase protein